MRIKLPLHGVSGRRLARWLAIVIAASSFNILAQESGDAANAPKFIADQFARAELTHRLIPEYLARFRHHREIKPLLTNKEIHNLVRAELPGRLKVEAAALKPIYNEELPGFISADIAPLYKVIAAHFIAGSYREALAIAEKQNHRHDIDSLRATGDAALALGDTKPGNGELDAALGYYRRAAAMLDKLRHPGPWAQEQRSICKLLNRHNREAEALPVMHEVVEIFRKEHGESSPRYWQVAGEYAGMLISAGRIEEVAALVEKAKQEADKRGDTKDLTGLDVLLKYLRAPRGKERGQAITEIIGFLVRTGKIEQAIGLVEKAKQEAEKQGDSKGAAAVELLLNRLRAKLEKRE